MTKKRNYNSSSSPIMQTFQKFLNDYSAMKASRFKRIRTGVAPLGGSADYHYRNETDYLKLIEYARDMDRNDIIVGQAVDRVVANTIQDGIMLDMNTGDKVLDDVILQRWNDWGDNPQNCDVTGEMTYHDMECLVLRHTLVDGDIIAIPLKSGQIQLIEAHRIRSLDKPTPNVINGIKLDNLRRRIQYWITNEEISPNQPITNKKALTEYPAYDKYGNRLIFHIYHPRRATQTRGVTAFAPIFDALGMFEDINFAKLVQQQIVSVFAIIRQRELGFGGGGAAQYGAQMTETLGDGSERLIDSLEPGLEVTGLPGETISGFSPNVPNPEFFDHAKMVLQLIGINLGLPLCLLLLDASETNFSGFRGAIDQARLGFAENQRMIQTRWSENVFKFKIGHFAEEDPAISRNPNFMRHTWNCPRWPYIEPYRDAQADDLRLTRNLISPRRLHAERGREYSKIIEEIIEDKSDFIELAIKRARGISDKYAVGITWRDLTGDSIKSSATVAGNPAPAKTETETPEEPKPNTKKKAGNRK